MTDTEDPTIITDEYLINEYHLSKTFINHHARKMGAFSRPRRFFKHLVDEYLLSLVDRVQARVLEEVAKREYVKQVIKEVFERAQPRQGKKEKPVERKLR